MKLLFIELLDKLSILKIPTHFRRLFSHHILQLIDHILQMKFLLTTFTICFIILLQQFHKCKETFYFWVLEVKNITHWNILWIVYISQFVDDCLVSYLVYWFAFVIFFYFHWDSCHSLLVLFWIWILLNSFWIVEAIQHVVQYLSINWFIVLTILRVFYFSVFFFYLFYFFVIF